MRDIQTKKDVGELVHTFYQRVQNDPLLSCAFNEVAQVDWGAHLPRMVEFWQTIVFRKPGYKGNPAHTHMVLAGKMAETSTPMRPEHFTHWVELFKDTVDDLFAGERAEFAKQSAAQMGHGLAIHIFGHVELFRPEIIEP